MKIRYNSPVILSFALVCVGILSIDSLFQGKLIASFFTVYPSFSFSNPLSWFRLVSHVLGHGGWPHLMGNLSYILLIGPLLEEKYGSANLFQMMFFTALVTGICNSLFFSTGLLGASGIVFMLILLGSFSNFRHGEIPLTFVLVSALFLGGEVTRAFTQDQISQFAHIMGGICGAAFGFFKLKRD
jgi:membrane associated rhomboid family serine protease